MQIQIFFYSLCHEIPQSRLRRFSVVLGAVLSAAALAQAQTTSVVTNGSFESGIAGWTVWQVATNSAVGTCGYNVTTALGPNQYRYARPP